MSHKVFIDGASGTTGLKIHEYFKKRDDIEVLAIDHDKRHDVDERLRLIEEADITFLCLPDDAAREIAERAPKDARIIDTSTAHRVDDEWLYGMAEMSPVRRKKIEGANRVTNPGCHATGAIFLIKPLIERGFVPKDYPFSVTSITGYSGGGKGMIADYEDEGRGDGAEADEGSIDPLDSPRQYGIGQSHKHIPEMMKYTGITNRPAFIPIVADYFSGMEVIVPLKGTTVAECIFEDESAKAKQEYIAEKGVKSLVAKEFEEFYRDQKLVRVIDSAAEEGFIAANRLAETNELEISIEGNDENIILVATFDNLGKGASGAAIQNMNIMLGLDETKGLL